MRVCSRDRAFSAALSCGVVLTSCIGLSPGFANAAPQETETPIRHVVVIVQENETFDHYFATYPNAANIPGETSWAGVPAPKFQPRPDTPSVNGLAAGLLTDNPSKSNTGAPTNPSRLTPMAAYTCDMNHNYTPEQQALNSGLVDQYPTATAGTSEGCAADGSTVMGYYDGNTVTALWNYAQNFAMSDNFFDTNYGPTGPGHIHIISGNTHGAILHNATSNSSAYVNPADGSVTMIGNLAAYLDDCGSGGDAGGTATPLPATFEMTSKNVGDLLNAANVTWGYFAGGFAPTVPAKLNPNGSTASPAVCNATHIEHEATINGVTYSVQNPTLNFTTDIHIPLVDYTDDHVEPFQYYASTRNPHHLRPSSVAAIGRQDQANHQYDATDFIAALNAGNFPAVSFVKPPGYEWGHPQSSDPLTEQAFLVQLINAIQESPEWSSTAVFIAWDDSDGWYDHVLPPIVSPSHTNVDALAGDGSCGTPVAGADEGRCGFGPRLPFLVISPWAKENYVDHNVTDQSSILAFIEENWHLGYIDGPSEPAPGTGSTDRKAGTLLNMFDFESQPNMRKLILDPVTGTPVAGPVAGR